MAVVASACFSLRGVQDYWDRSSDGSLHLASSPAEVHLSGPWARQSVSTLGHSWAPLSNKLAPRIRAGKGEGLTIQGQSEGI